MLFMCGWCVNGSGQKRVCWLAVEKSKVAIAKVENATRRVGRSERAGSVVLRFVVDVDGGSRSGNNGAEERSRSRKLTPETQDKARQSVTFGIIRETRG